MIPKDSTPIKNKILIDIIAKGLLSKDELRIIAYIVRWSWGFDGVERRQDWTEELKKRKIANDIGMAEQHLGRTINKMILDNKIVVRDKCYQFNEHYEEWKNLPKVLVLKKDKKLTKSVSKTNQKSKLNLPNRLVKLTKKVSLGMPNNQGEGIKNKDVRGGEHLSKDNKDNKEKKEKRILFSFNKKEFTNLTNKRMEKFDEKYPGIDVDQEIERMENWLMEEKKKRDNGEKDKIPKDYGRFMYNWLRRSNE